LLAAIGATSLPLGSARAALEPPRAPMMTRAIPRTGERLPVVGLGTDDYGEESQAGALAAVVRALVAGGGRLVDTASTYGASESLLGAVLAQQKLRPQVFIATKLEDYELAGGVGASLARLRTARIDLMMLHNVREPGQSLAALREAKAKGLVRYVGITTSSNSAFAAAEAVLRHERPDFLELDYSLGDREAEKRLLPAAAELGTATLIDLPFGRGDVFRAVRGKPLPQWAIPFAQSWGQFFLKYLIANPAVTVVIPGTTNPSHMADNLAAGRGRLPDAAERRRMVALIEAL
jgi:aryl-alcohol dehydrogenase-like predicted oxidoreductase